MTSLHEQHHLPLLLIFSIKQPLTVRWNILNTCHYNKAKRANYNSRATQNHKIKHAETDFHYLGDTLPPDTGASMNTAPIFSAATAISLETAGSMVEESISSVPFFTFLKRARQKALTLHVQCIKLHLYGQTFLFLH